MSQDPCKKTAQKEAQKGVRDRGSALERTLRQGSLTFASFSAAHGVLLALHAKQGLSLFEAKLEKERKRNETDDRLLPCVGAHKRWKDKSNTPRPRQLGGDVPRFLTLACLHRESGAGLFPLRC